MCNQNNWDVELTIFVGIFAAGLEPGSRQRLLEFFNRTVSAAGGEERYSDAVTMV